MAICLEDDHVHSQRKYDPYPDFEKAVKESFEKFQNGPLFTTNVTGLFEAFLESIPYVERHYYNCHACRDFINKYGGLVVISKDGIKTPVMWMSNNIPEIFKFAVSEVIRTVLSSVVTGVFLSKERVFGIPKTGIWTHMHVINTNPFKEGPLHTVSEVMAEKRSDFELLKRSLGEYPISAINQAVLFLRTDSLYRGEKVLGIAEWFRTLHDQVSGKHGKIRDNLIWKAVAQAPPGYCHVKNTMIGTLLDDIVSGMSFERASQRFYEKMNPTKYQRPQVAPSAGNIAKAEEIVEKLGIKRSLDRRFARLSEIPKLWVPIYRTLKPVTGVFSGITPKNAGNITQVSDIPQQNITWRSFLERILPDAHSMEIKVGSNENFCAILTASDKDAPPIIQWDLREQRNPFSWYVYNHGSSPSQWNLSTGWHKVTLITLQPSMWYNENKHQGRSAIFILENCKDTRYRTSGNGLFPEILKAELREVRSTIEAYSRNAVLFGYQEASACGIRLGDKNSKVVVRVTTDLGITTYCIDRWE